MSGKQRRKNEQDLREKVRSEYRKFYRLPEVLERYGVSKAFVYRGLKEGWFPKPRRLGPRAVAWFGDDLDNYDEQLEVA